MAIRDKWIRSAIATLRPRYCKIAIPLIEPLCQCKFSRFDPDLWCSRGRVFGFPVCLSGHSSSVRTFAQTKGQGGQVPFLGVLEAFRQPSPEGDPQYLPAFSKLPNACRSPGILSRSRNLAKMSPFSLIDGPSRFRDRNVSSRDSVNDVTPCVNSLR